MASELSDRAIGFSNPRVVTGDYNATPGSLTMKPNFYDRGFYEVDQGDNALTFAGAKIDYIFLKGLPRVCNGKVVRVTDPTSDHDTLVASTDV